MYDNYNSNLRAPRGLLIFAQIAGTFFSVIGLIAFIRYMRIIETNISTNDLTGKAVSSLLLAIIVYFVWRSVYTAFVIVRLAKHSSDEELCANRYIISALSLGVGGLITPFIMTSFPNVATTSTIKPRYFLSKTMGFCILIGAPILAFAYFIPLLSSPVTRSLIFNMSSAIGAISITVLLVSTVLLLFGAYTTKLFADEKNNPAFNHDDLSQATKIVSTIWMAILTFELVLVIVFALVRIITALIDLFRASEEGLGIFMMIFALLNLFITISYVGMVIYVTKRTMNGLWANDGIVTINKYEHSQMAQNRFNLNNQRV